MRCPTYMQEMERTYRELNDVIQFPDQNVLNGMYWDCICRWPAERAATIGNHNKTSKAYTRHLLDTVVGLHYFTQHKPWQATYFNSHIAKSYLLCAREIGWKIPRD